LNSAWGILATLLALPLSAQAWDLRVELPFPQGPTPSQTSDMGTGQAISGSLGGGNGAIFTASHRIIRLGPVLKLEGNAEYSHMRATGQIRQGDLSFASSLEQQGVGLGVNAQFWVPFSDLAGELGLLERFQSCRFEGAGYAENRDTARTWLRVGARWVLPFTGIDSYLATSYQAAIGTPAAAHGPGQNLGTYVSAQGSGLEFKRMWTGGVGMIF